MEWTNAKPSDDDTRLTMTIGNATLGLTRWGESRGSIAGRWYWHVSVGHLSTGDNSATREEAQRAIDAVLPIVREAAAKITIVLAGGEAQLVGAEA